MIETIWTYTVKPERALEFEKRYAANGDWTKLFRRSAGYQETRLLREVGAGRYVTIDAWDSLAALNSFKVEFAAEYEQLDLICSELTIEEQHVGIFTALIRD